MKLFAQPTAGLNAITAYGDDHIAVNGRLLRQSFIITPSRIIENWPPASLDELREEHVQAIAALDCPVVLLGTGQRQRFPAPALLRPLIQKQIGVEVMDSHAACRTYNILMAEGREVAAAIMLPSPI